MEIFKAKFIEKIIRTPSVASFRFAPEKKIEFLAGQFLKIMFDEQNLSNNKLNKYLSFSSSPAESYIEVTKRITESDFSGRLGALKKDDVVLFQGPLGKCVFKPEYRKIVFLIGGIGITPVISIIGYVFKEKLDNDIVLLYSNKTEEEIAFKKELDFWRQEARNVKIYYSLTDCTPKDEKCIYGRIDKGMVQDNVRDIKERTIFIFGPPRMVEAMQDVCLELECDKKRVLSENFIGY
ncbi:MAG: FAD-dependent oxidoreductase [Candidatus Omnitrophica bacterium]|nr:FAD-dependent oxidoreductase [Candidatus Omnitrophota bacterium]